MARDSPETGEVDSRKQQREQTDADHGLDRGDCQRPGTAWPCLFVSAYGIHRWWDS
jgi:hypothetical protein